MAKTLSAKVGEYTNSENQTKGEYVRVGVMLQGNDSGEFLLLDPSVNIAGCLTKQNLLNHKAGKQIRDSLLVSIFDDSNKQSGQQSQPIPNQPRATESATYDSDVPF